MEPFPSRRRGSLLAGLSAGRPSSAFAMIENTVLRRVEALTKTGVLAPGEISVPSAYRRTDRFAEILV